MRETGKESLVGAKYKQVPTFYTKHNTKKHHRYIFMTLFDMVSPNQVLTDAPRLPTTPPDPRSFTLLIGWKDRVDVFLVYM